MDTAKELWMIMISEKQAMTVTARNSGKIILGAGSLGSRIRYRFSRA